MGDHAKKYVYDRHPDENNLDFLLLFHYGRTTCFVSFCRLHTNLYVNLVCLSALNSFVLIFPQSSLRRSGLLRLPFIIPPLSDICIPYCECLLLFYHKFFQNDGIAATFFFLKVKIAKNHEKRIVFHGFLSCSLFVCNHGCPRQTVRRRSRRNSVSFALHFVSAALPKKICSAKIFREEERQA